MITDREYALDSVRYVAASPGFFAVEDVYDVHSKTRTLELGAPIIAWRFITETKVTVDGVSLAMTTVDALTFEGDVLQELRAVQNPDETVTVRGFSTFRTLTEARDSVARVERERADRATAVAEK